MNIGEPNPISEGGGTTQEWLESAFSHARNSTVLEPQFPEPGDISMNGSSFSAGLRREIPHDAWGVMQRVYGLRHSLLWPGQFALIDIFKFSTVWCLFVSFAAVIAKLFSP